MKFILLFFMSLISIGCVVDKNDVYKKIPKGSKLEKEILSASEQIYEYDSSLILVLDISQDWDVYDPHLLFFDKNLYLIAGCYFPSGKIDSISHDTIYGLLNPIREQRKGWYRNDLPPNFHLFLEKFDEEASERQSNKLVNEIIANENQVKLIVLRSENLYAGLQWSSRNADADIFKRFTINDTLFFSISELHINYEEQILSTRFTNSRNRIIRDIMIVPDKNEIDNLYNEIWDSLHN